jgi:hypothetical protein
MAIILYFKIEKNTHKKNDFYLLDQIVILFTADRRPLCS